MKEKVGIAIIGYGGMGDFHARNLTKRDDVEVLGIYDINPERHVIAKERNYPVFESREQLLADERVQVVVVATPNDVHKEIAISALAAGKHVVCEKPVAMDSSELDEMIAASNKYGKIFTVHQNRRWDSDYLTVKKMYDDNKLGRIFRVESRVHGSRGIPGDWRNKKCCGGGMLLDWGVHLLDQMLMMMEGKKITSVYATFMNISNEECDDGFTTIIKFDDGTEWLVEVSTNNFIYLPRWYVLGENGSAIVKNWDLDGEVTMVTDWENKDAVPVVAGAGLTKTMAPRTDDSIDTYPLDKVKGEWVEYYDNIVETINGRETQLITHDQIKRSMKLIETIFEAVEKNKVIEETF